MLCMYDSFVWVCILLMHVYEGYCVITKQSFVGAWWCALIRESVLWVVLFQVMVEIVEVKLYVTSFNHLVKLQEESKCFSFR